MGMWSDWYEKNAGKETCLTNAEFVLKAIDKAFNSAIEKLYPVGSIYISVNNTNPGIYLTGTIWTAWGSGRVPVGVDTGQTEFNTVEKTGGEKTHTLTIDEMSSHNHTSSDYGAHQNGDRKSGDLSTGDSDIHTVRINNTGGGKSHNNLQPYITCYMWKRTV